MMPLFGSSEKLNVSIALFEFVSQKCHTKCHKLVPVFGLRKEHKDFVKCKNDDDKKNQA